MPVDELIIDEVLREEASFIIFQEAVLREVFILDEGIYGTFREVGHGA